MSLPPMHRMKKIEVILEGRHLPFLQDLMARCGVSGYTVIRDVVGMGHHGLEAGGMTYSNLQGFVMAIAVGPEVQISTVIEGLPAFFIDHPGLLFVSDVAVHRRGYFPEG